MPRSCSFRQAESGRSKYFLPFYLLSLGDRPGQVRPWWSQPALQFSLASFLAFVAAAAIPAVDLNYGLWTKHITAPDATPHSIRHASQQAAYIIFAVGIIQLLLTWASLFLFMISSNTVTERLRLAYVSSILAQDTQWFDHHGTGEICSSISNDIEAIRVGFGEKMLHVTNGMGVLIGSAILGFVRSPSIAAVLFPIIPVVMSLFALLGLISDRLSRPTLRLEAQVASFMEQMLTSIRVVHAFGAADALMLRLKIFLLGSLAHHSRKRAIIRAFELSSVYAVMMWNYSAFFAWGTHQIAAGHVAIGPATTSFWSFINAFFTIANVVPHLGSILKALASLRALRDIIEMQPQMDVQDETGHRPTATLTSPGYSLGDISFSYPSRPDTLSLRKVSLKIEPNKFTAFVGPSGSGKSTILSLLLREFDLVRDASDSESGERDVEKLVLPQASGQILFGANNLKDLNLAWYRSQIAVVSQQLHLLPGTILENLESGLSDRQRQALSELSDLDRDTKLRQMAASALRKAQAYDFVFNLPNGMNTLITGGASATFSGGQRQRLALARALIRDFRVLLLDEATSALDSETEEKIRWALQQERRERPMTCCVVAHRLSTIQHADKIVVLVDGRVVDQGTHAELMHPSRRDQTYQSMFLRQQGEQPGTEKDAISTSHPLDTADCTDTDDTLSCADDETESLDKRLSENAFGGCPQAFNRLDVVTEMDESCSAGISIPPLHSGTVRLDSTPGLPMRHKLAVLWKHTSATRLLFLLGCFAALAASSVFPLSGYMTGKGIASLAAHTPSTIRHNGYFWSLMLFLMGIVNALFYTLQGFCLEYASSTLATALQQDALRNLMHQSLSAVEMNGEGAGTMAALLSLHPANIAVGTGTVLGNMIISAGNFVGSVAVAVALSWKATLVTFAPITLVVAASYVTVTQLQLTESRLGARSERCTDFLAGRLNAIRTIVVLGQQGAVLEAFSDRAVLRSVESVYIPILWASLGFAVGQSFVLLPSALVFYWTGTLFSRGEISLYAMYAVFELQLITGFAASRLTAFVPDLARAFASLSVVCGWLVRQREYHDCTGSHDGSVGDIHLRNVCHAYPQRPEQPVLRNVNLTIRKGATIALVGTSGSGKSSLLALLSRFYDPISGSIRAGGVRLPDWSLSSLRGRMALVSQDASLFQGSIRWNISLGCSNSDSIREQDVRAACKRAGILDFIDSLPAGLDTDIGMHGSQLSGGQRQRICIARALLRDPEVLLLDEATSALDAKSEAAVQETLSRAADGRTTIVVAHRLSTIRTADVIYVIEDGQIVEFGSHAQLLKCDSRYREVSGSMLRNTWVFRRQDWLTPLLIDLTAGHGATVNPVSML